ncbi:uncharacterized protein LOC110738964 [Chenopodium quinoa]|uniref:uncharacterized protein LOC110738964 n=1 Tax=Chenopodium quinoa TaxID=63459 RepID=UPI000B777AB6|nr:uncharacterized protein LOC110738964 [Chenopodium quinoa]XP_021775099.1 uncharacterized protein LOC110738964 [Chenopodium quinoa]
MYDFFRFNGRVNIYYPWFRFMDPINIRVLYGGNFVTRNNKTTYGKGNSNYFGLSLHPNVEEVCYFEFVDWIKRELGYDEVGEIWYRKHGCTLYSGRKQIKCDANIPEFLEAKEKDGWYELYLVHYPKKQVDPATIRYGLGVGFYSDSELDSSERTESSVGIGESLERTDFGVGIAESSVMCEHGGGLDESMVSDSAKVIDKSYKNMGGGPLHKDSLGNPRSKNNQVLLPQTSLLSYHISKDNLPPPLNPKSKKLPVISKAKINVNPNTDPQPNTEPVANNHLIPHTDP